MESPGKTAASLTDIFNAADGHKKFSFFLRKTVFTEKFCVLVDEEFIVGLHSHQNKEGIMSKEEKGLERKYPMRLQSLEAGPGIPQHGDILFWRLAEKLLTQEEITEAVEAGKGDHEKAMEKARKRDQDKVR